MFPYPNPIPGGLFCDTLIVNVALRFLRKGAVVACAPLPGARGAAAGGKIAGEGELPESGGQLCGTGNRAT